MGKPKIILFKGPMFSGKSGRLNRELKKLAFYEKNKICKIIFDKDKEQRYQLDQSHDGITPGNTKLFVRSEKGENGLSNEFAKVLIEEGYTHVGIDEGQFFEGLAEFCDFLRKNKIRVYVAALNATFERKPWPEISNLCALTNKEILFRAICSKCGNKANNTKRLIESDDLVKIGGAKEYQPRCDDHFFED